MLGEKILELFSFLSRLEQSTQARKKVLNNYYEYNPAKIFKKLDTENKGHINLDNISSFLNNHYISYTPDSLKLLVIFYDSDFDGLLSFEEFISLIQNDNILLNNKKTLIGSNNDDISFNLEYCLTKIFEKEIELNQYIINILKKINKNINGNLSDLFNYISLNKDYINKKDIMNYLDENRIDYTENQINDIMKRLDLNKDGKIDFNEFDYLFGLVKSNNFNEINLNRKIPPLNNYINNYDSTTNFYNDINNYDEQNYQNNIPDLNTNENNPNIWIDNELYQTSTENHNNQNKTCCIHCINIPCCDCQCYQNQINQNIIENSNTDLLINSYNNNSNPINSLNNKNNENNKNIEYSDYMQNNINNYELNNNNYNNDEYKKKEHVFPNFNDNNNNFNFKFDNNSNIYSQKNFKYDDKPNNIYNKKFYNNNNYNYNTDIANSINNINNIIDNINYKYNNKSINNNYNNKNLENNYQNQSSLPIKKEKISNSLSLRKSPIRKNYSTKNYNNKINNNYNLNNINNNINDSSYFYEMKNCTPLNQTKIETFNSIKYNNLIDSNTNSLNNNSNYNYPMFKRNHSQGNFIINKNNILKNNFINNKSYYSNTNSNVFITKEKNILSEYFKL